MFAVSNANTENPRWITCSECGAACIERPLSPGMAMRCGQCGVVVRKACGVNSLQPAWALATTGLLLVILANVNPILTFDVAGNTQSNLIISGVFGLFSQGYWPVAALVFSAGIAGPALHLATMWYVLAACCLRRRLPAVNRVRHLTEVLESWNLVPVYAVATVIAVVKLDMLGAVTWQKGALWVLGLSLCSLFTMQLFDRNLVEKRLEELA